MSLQNVKCFLVGEHGVGKTTLLITFTEDRFPCENVPTIFDTFTTGFETQHVLFNLSLWEGRGSISSREYSRSRCSCYPETDVFLVCFSIADRDSFRSVKEWV